jgi:hypothetical protein
MRERDRSRPETPAQEKEHISQAQGTSPAGSSREKPRLLIVTLEQAQVYIHGLGEAHILWVESNRKSLISIIAVGFSF